MSTETYYLISPDGEVVARFNICKRTSHAITGNCYSVVSWYDGEPYEYEFVANAYLKWDACTHWYFSGEDYDPEIEDSMRDAYYHLCGGHCFMSHIRCMCFMWKLTETLLSETSGTSSTYDWYYDDERIKPMIDLVLKDYTIKKLEEQNEIHTKTS